MKNKQQEIISRQNATNSEGLLLAIGADRSSEATQMRKRRIAQYNAAITLS
jgi:hypothetical protein